MTNRKRLGLAILVVAQILILGALVSAVTETSEEAEAPEIRRLGKHHSSSDKSVAGGGVIIGGLVTAIFAAVFCYIRVTRRRDDHHALHSSSMPSLS